MADKLPINLPIATPGAKIVHAVNTDDPTDTPQGTSQKVQVAGIDPLLSEGQVPKFDVDQKLVYSGATVDTTTGEWTFDKTVNIPAGSLNVGAVVTLSEGGEDLIISDNINTTHGFAITADFDSSGSSIPAYFNLGTQFSNTLQPDDSVTTTTSPILFPIIGGVTAPDIRQTNQVTFRSDGASTNITAKVTDNSSGVVIRYIPSKAAFDAVTAAQILENPGLDFINGDNIVDFVSKLPDSPGVFNVGISPFRLVSGQQIDVEIKASSMSLKGNAGGIPFLTQLIQEGPALQMTNSDGADQRQIIRSGIKENFTVASQTLDTEVAITADIGGEFDVFFNANPVIDNLDGSVVTIADQVHSVPNSPTGAKYFVHATSLGVIGVSVTKTTSSDLTQVHLFEYIAINGTLIPESLIANPTLSWSDKTLEGILSTDSIRVNDLVVGSTDDATLGLTTTNFELVGASQNYEQSKINPHVKSVVGQDPQNWTYLIQSSTTIPPIGADVLLDPTQYDNAGVLTAVGANQASVQLVVVEGDDFGILYGQQLFNNYDDAILNMDAIEFIIPPGLFSAVEVCRIAIKGNATDSADDQEVTIRNFASGSSGGSTSGFTTQSLIAPSFADARFFSELGLADGQGWNIVTSGVATVTIVSESVFGVTQDVHKLADNTSGGIASVTLPLTAADWTNIFNFDASYSGVFRLDSVDGDEGCFLGLGCLAADSPDASPDKRRFGLNLKKSLTTNELRVFGTDGNPLDVDVPGTVFDEYNEVVIKITRGTPPTAEVFVNGDSIGVMGFLVHTGGTATDCSWSSGSTGGVDRITYASNYGVTVYSSDNVLVIGDTELNVDLAKTVLPPGRRDYTIRLEEAISGAKVGNTFEIVALNNGGLITVDNENPSNPKALFNGLNTVTVQVNGVLTTNGVNSVDGGNVYDFNLPSFQQLANGTVILYNEGSTLLLGDNEDDGTGSKLQVTGGLSVDGNVINTTDTITIFYEGVLTAQFSLLETRTGVSLRYFGADKEIVSINAALGTSDSGAFKGSMFLRVNGAQMSANTTMSGSSNTVVNVPVNVPPFFLTNGDTIDIDYSDGTNVDALNLMVYLEVR